MSKSILAAACAAAVAIMPTTVSGQTTKDSNADALALGKCFVGKSSAEDRKLIAKWMGASIAMSPNMQDVVTIDEDAKDRIDRRMAETFTRLMSDDCRTEMTVLIKKNDAMGIQAASAMLGQMAMQELLRDPATMQALIAYARHMDPAMMRKLAE